MEIAISSVYLNIGNQLSYTLMDTVILALQLGSVVIFEKHFQLGFGG